MLKMCDIKNNKSSEIAEGGSALFRTGNVNLSPNAQGNLKFKTKDDASGKVKKCCKMETLENIPCSFGNLLGDTCHKTTYARLVGLMQLDELTSDEKELVLLRTGSNVTTDCNNLTLCKHHEQVLLRRYESHQISCCDPF